MRHFPVFLELQDRACLVVGTTEEAHRKAQTLREAGAAVTAVDGGSAIPASAYALAVVATGDLEQDTAIAKQLKPLVALINVVDRPSLCSFIWPAIVERGPVTVAVSTGGTSPTLAALVRQRIERAVPAAVGDLARLAGRLRRVVAATLPGVAERRRFWRRALEGRSAALAFAGDSVRAKAALRDEARALLRSSR
jgi:uroporphyrin-III C-methyltransferase / precorrin-2 dehydrogenase / sirohydrochlorin ferrochelatase